MFLDMPVPSLTYLEMWALIIMAIQMSCKRTIWRIWGVATEQSFSQGRVAEKPRKKQAYQLVILPKCLRCSTPLVRGPFFITPLLWNLPRSISSGYVVNVARKANGQTFILLRSPHYRARQRKRATALLFLCRQVFWCLYAQWEEGEGAADCTVSISAHWWKNSHCY